MKKYLVTGIGGFVGRYFWEYLLDNESDFNVLGVDLMVNAPWEDESFQYRQADLGDSSSIKKIMASWQPDCIVHLASVSSVGQSWNAPSECFINNTAAFLNLVEAVRSECPLARVLSVGSSEEYGNHPSEKMPLREDYALIPCSPYAVARVSQEMLSRLYAESFGLNIMMTRSFNHIGPRQREAFAVPSFAKQLVEIAKAGGKGVLHVGNIDVVRDFLDVRDVVDAYFRILNGGMPGAVYNVCSGTGTSLRRIIISMSKMLGVDPEIRIDKALARPADNAVIIGDNSRLCRELGWRKKTDINKTLHDIIAYFGGSCA